MTARTNSLARLLLAAALLVTIVAATALGPVVAAGWLAATAVGAAAGAATGGIVGALTEAGISDEDAQKITTVGQAVDYVTSHQ